MTEILEGAQRGLLTCSLFGQFLTVHLENPLNGTYKSLINIIQDLAAKADSQQPRCGLLVGFSPEQWGDLQEDILINGDYKGSSFAFTQRFVFDWEAIISNTSDSQNTIVGRRPDGSILSQHATRGHVHRANVRDSNGDQRKLLRQALPFGRVGHHAGREEGNMFVALCNDQQRFEDILQNLLGTSKEDPADQLMQMVSGVGGSY
ncbi:MAG: hypothetical protein L6R38_005502 [Xanthoria sp. 2 TBL-2021]|nr:MAG: hypothetical protein L6R38_005502 [Xanthoria sp. 2 TBL-2021]